MGSSAWVAVREAPDASVQTERNRDATSARFIDITG
jgi:hypothetical protein